MSKARGCKHEDRSQKTEVRMPASDQHGCKSCLCQPTRGEFKSELWKPPEYSVFVDSVGEFKEVHVGD
jgi:hypothetical protein